MKKNKVILSLIFVLIFAFSAFVLPACAVSCNGTPPSPEQTQGNNNNTGNNGNNGGNTNNNSGTTPGGNSGEESKFSSILNKVLTDEYYTDIVVECSKNGLNLKNNMEPIPYRFLKQQGFNIQDYLDDKLEVFASSYIYENDNNHIYVSVKAENVSTHEYGNYYSNYVLKYSLTNQEYYEYTELCKDGYLQGLLFIQELDNQKTPEVVSHVNIAKYTYNLMINTYDKDYFNPKNFKQIEIDVSYADMEKLDITLRGASHNTTSSTSIGNTEFTYKKIAWPNIYEGDVFYLTNPVSVNFDVSKYESSFKDITSFSYSQQIDAINSDFIYEEMGR